MNDAERSARAYVDTVLEERARLYARPLARGEVAETTDVVRFAIGSERFAIEAAVVRRIVPLPPLTKLPGTPPYALGIANVRGQLIPVFDLVRLLGIPPTGETTQLVVLGRDAFDFGILAGAVTEMVSIAAVPRGDARSARSILRVLSDGCSLIDGPALIDDPRLVIGAHAPHQVGEELQR